MYKVICIIIYLFGVINLCFAQKNQQNHALQFKIDSVKVENIKRLAYQLTDSINIDKERVVFYTNDITVFYSLKVNNFPNVKIPNKIHSYGVSSLQEMISIFYIVEKFDTASNTFKRKSFDEEISTNVFKDNGYITLSKYDKYANELTITNWQFGKGHFRLRLNFLLSNFNNAVSDILSDWSYFDVQSNSIYDQ